MLSKNKAKFIVSLQKKKARDEEGLFVIEGDKLVREFLTAGMPVDTLIAKPEFLGSLQASLTDNINDIEEISYNELRQISTLKTPHNALALVAMPHRDLRPEIVLKDLCAAIDFVQDPGNLGTIIRAAGWFGIKNIVCSKDCVDVYNPKVVQASMGALIHVNVFYYDLSDLLDEATKSGVPVFGTLLDGESIYSHKLDNKGVIALGNESKGISQALMPFITEKIMIPGFSVPRPGIDSLNVGMAATVVFSEFLRRSATLTEE